MVQGEGRATLVELCAIGGHAVPAEGRRIGDRVELEAVDVAVELKRDHPVHQPASGDACPRGSLRVQRQQPPAGVPDDSAGVVGTGNHLQGGAQRLVGDGVDLRRIGARDGRLKGVHGLVHLTPVRVRGAPVMQVCRVRISGRTASANEAMGPVSPSSPGPPIRSEQRPTGALTREPTQRLGCSGR